MENRKTLTVTLETVTPLFLGGAEPRPELRPPAFRGALRYWLRAALGGVIGDNNLAALHKLESAVFGSTDYGSPIHLRLHNPRPLQSGDEKILPHKEGKQAAPRRAFSSGQTVKLSLSQFRSDDETIWQAACAALNLTLTFGGIGLRSRRGYGTLRVVESSESAIVPLFPISLDEWKHHILHVTTTATIAAQTLAQTQKILTVPLLQKPAHYPCVTTNGLVRICQVEAKSAMAAVTQFMKKASRDYAFGGVKPRRQASPLWVRPIQLDDHYGLLLTVLASQFKGANYDTVRSLLDQNFPGEDIHVKGWNA